MFDIKKQQEIISLINEGFTLKKAAKYLGIPYITAYYRLNPHKERQKRLKNKLIKQGESHNGSSKI